MSSTLEAGERIILLDSRGRRFLVHLRLGETFHHHAGTISHDELIGAEEGATVRTPSGAALVAFRPRLADFVLKMARGAQVVYPKDLGPILIYADIFPGARVLEAGTGSGALTLALCRAVGPDGAVVSYERREEFRQIARNNIETFLGALPPWLELREGDVLEADGSFDRVVLDLPEPDAAVHRAAQRLVPGGILCAYVPNTGQVQALVLSMQHAGFAEVETMEIILRTWHVSSRSVRPDHRMVGHTGFITTGRRAGPAEGRYTPREG